MEQKKLILYSDLSHQAKVLLLQNEIETIDHLMRLSQDELIRLQRLDQNVGSEIGSYIENHQTSTPSGFKQIRDWVRQGTNRVLGRFHSHNDSNHQNGDPLVHIIENDVKESMVDGPQVEETSPDITSETVNTDETLTQTTDNEEVMVEDIVPEEAAAEGVLPGAVKVAKTIGAESTDEEAVTINKNERSYADLEIISKLSMQEIVNHRIYKMLIIDYLKANDIELDTLPLSVQSQNVLFQNGIFTMSKLFETGFDKLAGFRNPGKKPIDEITEKTISLLESKRDQIIAYEFGEEALNKSELCSADLETIVILPMQEILNHRIYKMLVIDYLKDNDIDLDTLPLSVRSKNALFRNGIFTMSKLLETGFDNIAGFRNLGKKSIDEISEKTISLLESKHDRIIAYGFGEEALAVSESVLDMQDQMQEIGAQPTASDQENVDNQRELSPEGRKIISSTPIHILLGKPVYRKAILDYFASHDIQVTNMPLSVRSKNALLRNKIDTFSRLLELGVDDLFNIRNIGRQSRDDIQKVSLAVLESCEDRVKRYLCGTQEITYTDQQICQDLIHYFNKMTFSGVSFTQICEALPEGIDHERIKKLVGSLIADGTLEYVDYRCYRVYPSVFSVLADDTFRSMIKHPDILIDKLKGKTLEEIGQKAGVTRERVRQLFKKEFVALKSKYQRKTGMHYFDEDYYGYLFKKYYTEKDLWTQYLGVPQETFSYLKNAYKAGDHPIEKALDDPRLDLRARLCVQDFLNRNKILIEGVLVERSRAAVEDLFLKNHCQNEMKFEDFAAAINRYLEENNVPYDDKLYYTDAVTRTRSNKFGAAMNCLWKQGGRLRYYNIEERDYSELLEIIDLDQFENIELSTLKFFEDYPELMQRYDIRDQYELHNLLKKIVPEGSYHDLSFGRQPTITFGTFDRAQAMLDLLVLLSPVSAEDLVDHIHRAYGYDKATVQATVLAPLKQYYHEGIYSVTFKRPTAEREAALLQMLADDFYYIDDVRQIYLNGFPGADPQEINPFTLKEMGFKVNARYAFRNYPSAEAYFTEQLTKQDIYDISEFKKKYNGLSTAGLAYDALRHQYDIFLFDNNQIITLARLKQFNIDKQDIYQFCADVNEFVTDNTYFNYCALRKEGFHSKLDKLGFDDTFYDGILEVCPYFKPIKLQGNTLLYKSIDEREITRGDFFCWLISKYGSIEQDDLLTLCSEGFGIQLTDKYLISHIIRSTNIY